MPAPYSFGKGLLKAVISFVLFAIPFAVQATPSQYMNLTVGGILAIIFNAVKFYYNQNFAS